MFRKASSSMATCPNLNSPTDLADEAEISTKQHTVPRMLQKGFTLDRNQRTTWLMRPGRKPEIRNIKTIWKRAGAYSTSETADLDGAISGPQGEGKVCRTLTQLRQGGGEIQRAEIGALVSHLETRGDHVIDNLLGSRALNDVVLSVIGEDAEFEKWQETMKETVLGIDEAAESERIGKELEKGRHVQEHQHEITQRTVLSLIRYVKDIATTTSEERRRGIQEHREMQPKQIVRAVRAKHLAKDPVVQNRAGQFAQMDWHLHRAPCAILGTSMVFYKVRGRNKYSSFVHDRRTIEGVYVPIETNLVLVGGENGVSDRDMRLGAARTSTDGFICSRIPEDRKKLEAECGKDVLWFTQEQYWRIAERVCQLAGIPVRSEP